MKTKAFIGQTYKHITLMAVEGTRRLKNSRGTYYRFRCECGNEFSSQYSNAMRGRGHCGCMLAAPNYTAPAGVSTDLVYKVWSQMIRRCENPKDKSFKDYGARGIKVCERWKTGDGNRTGFECFTADMGPRPKGMTVERVQRDGNYEPGNCMWLPKGDQSKNRRGVRLVRIGNEVKTIPDWCAVTGIDYWTAIRRVIRGWPPDKAVTHPIRKVA